MKKKIGKFKDKSNGKNHSGRILDSKSGFDVIECDVCEFKHIIPIPNSEELKNLYEEKFYSSEKPEYFKNVQEDLQWWELTYRNYYKMLEKYCQKNKRKLLEIGSGPGYFLKTGKKLGWDALGFEPSKQAYEYSKKLGVKVVNNFFDEKSANKYAGQFDVVYIDTVIEHLPDPISLLKNARKTLKPGGIIFITTPSDYNPLQTILRKDLGFKPWWVFPPQHINYFDFDSIKKLVKRVGFNVLDLSATFPMEFFLLSGKNYVDNERIGRECHAKRKNFEINMYKNNSGKLRAIYTALAKHGIGRDFIIIGKKK
jgi:SAM-dependent methyltransferase